MISVPAHPEMWSDIDVWAGHVRRYQRKQLVETLQAAGFAVERIECYGYPLANRVEPGKRPRSSMSPTIVMQDGAPVLVIGSPGGSRIIGYVAQAIIGWMDWGMDVQQAVAMGHVVNRFGTTDLEEGTEAADLAEALTGLGFEVNMTGLDSGLHAIEIGDGLLLGGADPRREGIALGN